MHLTAPQRRRPRWLGSHCEQGVGARIYCNDGERSMSALQKLTIAGLSRRRKVRAELPGQAA